ncbi:MAG: NADH-quinone oxidoreductase subunit L, partial [Thermoprotei archaeon]
MPVPYDLSWLIPALPLAASPIPILGGKIFRRLGGYLAIIIAAVSAALSLYFLVYPPSTPLDYSRAWILPGSGEPITVGIYVDHLSLVMASVTASIATIILVYSLGYMEHEDGLPRYWTEMLLFTGSMLGFSLADSLISMYVFWELVGVCSYLLIGFWYTRPEVASAAKKAFVVTRVGDVAFLIGLIEIYIHSHTLSLPTLISNGFAASVFTPTVITVVTLLIFFGAVGKSAQLPLFTWLPDAMEGPTTVSALIHSATMVAAGVYLVARLYPLFLAAPISMEVVALVGSVSAFVAGTMALTTYDLKRILAYSTMSQLGYMMAALGVGALQAGMFQLVTHAVFKALLFLSAGSILHVLGTRDIREMGGLLRKMKITSAAFIAGALSLSGIFPFNGFFSKDLILGAAYEYGLRTGDFWV